MRQCLKYHPFLGVGGNIIKTDRMTQFDHVTLCHPNSKRIECVELATTLLACIVPRITKKELDTFLKSRKWRTYSLLCITPL